MRALRFLVEASVGSLCSIPIHLLKALRIYRPRTILIGGWYGTETVGDVAILGQILDECDQAGGLASVITLDLEITKRSLDDLGRSDVILIPIGIRSGIKIASSRILLYGGGPLMESKSMPAWALRALTARLAGTRVGVYACGIGPLRSEWCTNAVGLILRLANFVILRDRSSVESFPEFFSTRPAMITADPALNYVGRRKQERNHVDESREKYLALALRFPPKPYLAPGTSESEAALSSLETLASTLNQVATNRNVKFLCVVMHDDDPENNDRAVYRSLGERMEEPERLVLDSARQGLPQVIGLFRQADAALTIRFHAMVFSVAMELPFTAIDYCYPHGKTSAAATDLGVIDSVVSWEEMEPTYLATRLIDALDKPRSLDTELELIDKAVHMRVGILREHLC